MKKGKKNIFMRLLSLLFLLYIALLIAYESGYYETKAKNRATMTKEAMEQFENDVMNGQLVDVKEYLKEEKVDYSNGITKIGNKISSGISDIMTKGLTGIFDTLKGLFW